jgi:hypothetical protein
MANNRRVAVSNACHNLWHTGVKHQQYYHEIRPFCMCRDQTEDWQQVLTCPLIDAALHRADSRVQLQKTLKCWKIPNDFWMAVEKGMQSYATVPKKAKDRTIPTTPVSLTWNREINALKAAYHAQSKIGWENLVKGRIAQECIQFMETHHVNQGYKLKAQDWAPTCIGDLWEHTHRVLKFRNSINHTD